MQELEIKNLKSKIDKEIELKAWVQRIKILGKISFIILRDRTGIIQAVALKDKLKDFKKIEDITPESVVEIKGKIKANKEAKLGYEIILKDIKLLNKAQTPLPIDIEKSQTHIDKRLDYRFLDIRRPEVLAIFKIQATIVQAFRDFFIKKDFIEFQPPSIIAASSEGGTDLFETKYFEHKAYLAQSPQLYKQMLINSMKKVFTITPVWRAEKHNTPRHLNECRQMDIEVAFTNQKQIMKYLEDSVKYIVEQVIEKNKQELKLLKVNLKVPKAKYLSYQETVELLGIKFGEDLTPENEKELEKKFPDTIVFVHSWPRRIKPFYIMPKKQDPKSNLSEGFDAIYQGAEISSGGQRIHIPELLEKLLKQKELNPKHFKMYIDSFRYGSAPHSGWSIGLERLTMTMLNLQNIREACLWPRDRDRLVP